MMHSFSKIIQNHKSKILSSSTIFRKIKSRFTLNFAKPQQRQQERIQTGINYAHKATKDVTAAKNKSSSASHQSHLIFPGGGIFFYWQAGAITYLRENNYDLENGSVSLTGASTGALVATLTASNVDFERATESAFRLAEEGGVWDRPLGLQGVWGEMIETWLDELLPEDAVEKLDNKLSLLATLVPSFGKTKVSNFDSRSDLIKCNMASIHIPWFLDGKLTSSFRDQPHIDGSFLSQTEDYHPHIPTAKSNTNQSLIQLDWSEDPVLSGRSLADALTALSKEGIWDLLEQGKKYASFMEERGDFQTLPRRCKRGDSNIGSIIAA